MKPERQVEELFHAALEREPSERDAFLEEACAGDGARLDDGHLRAAMLTRVLGVALGLALLVLGVVPAGETSPRDFSTAVIVLPRDRAAPRGGPATDQFRRPESVERELAERDAPFAALRRVDALFVPGGDPGGLHPDVLFPWLGRVAEVLQKHHPEARLRVSDQIMKTDPSWYEAYYAQVNRRPAWLGGVVFGPWGATPLPKMREIVDPVLPIRRYPDISHTVIGQYPVPDWDLAFAMTLGREPIIPRPVFFKHVHNLLDEHAVGRYHLLGRRQRGRQQVRLDRSGLGPGHAGRGDASGLRAPARGRLVDRHPPPMGA